MSLRYGSPIALPVSPGFVQSEIENRRGHAGIYVAAADSPAWKKLLANYACDGVADQVQWQAAIDEAQTYVGSPAVFRAPRVIIEDGEYRFDAGVALKSAAVIGPAPGAVTARVYWDGAPGASVFTKAGGPGAPNGGKSFACLANLRLDIGTAEPGTWLDLSDTGDPASTGLDVFFHLSYIWFRGGDYHIKLGSWVNAHFEHLRFDNWHQYAIDLAPASTQNASSFVLDKFTCDHLPASNPGKGFLHITIPTNTSNIGKVWLNGFRAEINAAFAAPQGFVVITHPNPAGSRLVGLHISNFTYQDSAAMVSDVLIYRETADAVGVDAVILDGGGVHGLGALFGGTLNPGFAIPPIPTGGHINRISTSADESLVFGQRKLYPRSSTEPAITSRLAGEAFDRFSLRADGRLEWGGGAAALDVNLYRSGTGLATDDKFLFLTEVEIDGNLNHDGTMIGLYGVAPVTRGTVAANATDLATAITLVNDLKAKLIALGAVQ